MGLRRKAREHVGSHGVSGKLPFDPVGNSQREWVRLPSHSVSDAILGNPSLEKVLGRRVAVMQIVKPQRGNSGVVPRLNFAFLIKKAKAISA